MDKSLNRQQIEKLYNLPVFNDGRKIKGEPNILLTLLTAVKQRKREKENEMENLKK